MKPYRILVFLRLAAVSVLVLLATPVAVGGRTAPRLRADKAYRGIAVLSSSVGNDVSVEELETFVRTCRIDFVVVDFAWITFLWGQTDPAAVEKLAKRLGKAGVVVAAMYRPRTLSPTEAEVHCARDEAGDVASSHNDLCLAHEDSVEWGAAWGTKILASCPSIDHMILYNVAATCRCVECRGGMGVVHGARFMAVCRERWKKVRSGVKIGHVGPGLGYAEQVDFFCPFFSVNRTAEDRPVETDALAERTKALLPGANGKPLVPLAKVCWTSATKNDTEDVAATVRSLEKAGLGFLLWYYEWLFYPDEGRYDPEALVAALGGDWSKIRKFLVIEKGEKPAKPKTEAPPSSEPPKADADSGRWIYFDSRETATPPKLVIRPSGGKERVFAPSADTVLISYLAESAQGKQESLSISLGDTNRVLLKFPMKRIRGIERAELRLSVHPSAYPPTAPFDVTVHVVTESWQESVASWSRPPSFESEPILTVEIPHTEGEVVLDLTDLVREWTGRARPNYGILLKAGPPRPEGRWTQPEIRTGTPFSDTIPWAATIEDALERARREKKPVLATVVPLSYRRWCSGYRASESELKGITAHEWGDDRIMAIDPGLAKERAMMASLFTDPEVVHLVKTHFVPVRVRLYTSLFDAKGNPQSPDPLPALGTSALAVGGPSLVFARPDGRLLHACRRMGVFSVPWMREMLRAVLQKAGVSEVAPYRPKRHLTLTKAWERARRGKFAEAGKLLGPLTRKRGSPHYSEATYLLAHIEDKLGDPDRAEELFRLAAKEDPEGPWGSKAAVRLLERGIRLDEWESFATFEFDPLAERTEIGATEEGLDAVMERAVDYLLLQQRPDGGWRDSFMDVEPMSGPGSQWDHTVPRTGLVVDALIRMKDRLPRRKRELTAAIAKGVEFVGRFADRPEPHIWKLTYALHLQVALLRSDLRVAKDRARKRAALLVDALFKCRHDGGWSYMLPPRIHSFNTAPVLLLLTELRDLSVPVPTEMTDDAAAFLEGLRQKDPRDFAYAANLWHGEVRASSCRTTLCELALLLDSGNEDLKGLRAGIDLFFEHDEKVRDTTKIFESYFSPTALHDAYHYYFGHYYTARALEHLPAAEAERHARRQIEMILGQVEMDGSFVDAQMQGKSYSTAMALLTLLEALRHVPR